MKWMIACISMAVLTACGDDQKVEETVSLESTKEKLSYCLGAEQAKMITESGDPNLEKLDFEAMMTGFSDGLKKDDGLDADCRASLMKLYGPYGQDFDTSAVKSGSTCIGRIAGSVFYNGWLKKNSLDKIDMAKAKIGFNHALMKKDTLVDMKLRSQLVSDFLTGLNKKSGEAMLAAAAKMPNARKLEGGVILVTLEEGKGGSPTESEDIEADYILTNSIGDTLENSIAYRAQNGSDEKPKFNLQGVIRGWTIGYQQMKKGGKYRLYVPWDLAYGEAGGYESLCFYIDFVNYGPAGTIAPPRQ